MGWLRECHDIEDTEWSKARQKYESESEFSRDNSHAKGSPPFT